MGKVYRGYDQRLDRPVALKHIRADTSSTSARERFRREARSVARLNHPSIVQVFDWVETSEGDWLVMELVDGQSLKRLLMRGPLPPWRTKKIARQILSGLAIAHAAGIVHRDLKPDNIMLTAGDQVKILDFGLAKHVGKNDNEPALTIEGRLIGTVSAMSPEQAVGESVDHRSDLFSLGTLLYEALTGVSPFHSENKVQTLTRICTLQQRAVIDLRPEVEQAFSDIVDHLMEKEPEDRPHSALEVMSALDTMDESSTSSSDMKSGSVAGTGFGAPIPYGTPAYSSPAARSQDQDSSDGNFVPVDPRLAVVESAETESAWVTESADSPVADWTRLTAPGPPPRVEADSGLPSLTAIEPGPTSLLDHLGRPNPPASPQSPVAPPPLPGAGPLPASILPPSTADLFAPLPATPSPTLPDAPPSTTARYADSQPPASPRPPFPTPIPAIPPAAATSPGFPAGSKVDARTPQSVPPSPPGFPSRPTTSGTSKPSISISRSSMTETGEGPSLQVAFRMEGGVVKNLELTHRRKSILDLAKENEIEIYSECGGRARCSTCRIRILGGIDNVMPRKPREAKLADRLGWEDEIRLACQTRIVGDVTVERLVRDSQDVGLLLDEHSQTLPAQEATLAILTCELLDFDQFATKAPPYDQIHLLHRFLTQMGGLISAHKGRIQNYTGTGFRAFFGLDGGSADEKCLAAIRAGLRIAERMRGFNRYASTYFSTELQLGLGLHFGRMVVGQFGSPSKRHLLGIGEAAALTDAVSAHNSTVGTTILATEELINIVEDEVDIGDIFPEEPLGGRSASLYEIYDLENPDAVFLVQNSFERLSSYEEAPRVFYDTIFELEPAARALFTDVDMEAQGQKFVTFLSMVVNGIDRLDEMRSQLREMGERHVHYGVERSHYGIVGQALLTTVEKVTGIELTLEARSAWTEFYNKMVNLMLGDA